MFGKETYKTDPHKRRKHIGSLYRTRHAPERHVYIKRPICLEKRLIKQTRTKVEKSPAKETNTRVEKRPIEEGNIEKTLALHSVI